MATPIPAPFVQIFQQFVTAATELVTPLRPLIMGPEYRLHRYAVESERALAAAYNPVVDTEIEFVALGRSAGAVVDQAYTTINLLGAQLAYYDRPVGGGQGATSAEVVAGSGSAVRMAGLRLQTANGLALDAIFQGRDVQIGDFATLTLTTGPTTETASGEIIGFIDDIVAASIGTATEDASNRPRWS